MSDTTSDGGNDRADATPDPEPEAPGGHDQPVEGGEEQAEE